MEVLIKKASDSKLSKSIIDGSLGSLQTLVGGLIEEVRYKSIYDMGITILVNEEGKLLNLDKNIYVIKKDGTLVDILVGDVAFLGFDGGDFCSITQDQEDFLKKVLVYVPDINKVALVV